MSTSFALFRADILLVLLLEYELVKNMSNEVDLNDGIMKQWNSFTLIFEASVRSGIYNFYSNSFIYGIKVVSELNFALL